MINNMVKEQLETIRIQERIKTHEKKLRHNAPEFFKNYDGKGYFAFRFK